MEWEKMIKSWACYIGKDDITVEIRDVEELARQIEIRCLERERGAYIMGFAAGIMQKDASIYLDYKLNKIEQLKKEL